MQQQRALPQRRTTKMNSSNRKSSTFKSATRSVKRMNSQSATAQPLPSHTEPQKRVTIAGQVAEIPSGFEQQHRMSTQHLASDKAETELMSNNDHIVSEHTSWKDLQHINRRTGNVQKEFKQNREMCRTHAFCVPDHQEERIPIEVKVTYPLPYTTSSNDYLSIPQGQRHFLKRVEDKTFGESGPQRDGTKTVLTQYSLDHYLAQQWNLDVENMPYMMPESMAAVQKRFMTYSRKGVQQVKISQGAKPTLQKKFNEWERAKLEQKQRQLELLYFRTNQDPKVLSLLEQFKVNNPSILGNKNFKKRPSSGEKSNKGQSPQGKQGKRTDASAYRLEGKDMVPMVYQSTMQVDPLIHQLQKEHEEVMKIHIANPGAPFGDCAQKYYEKKEKQEKEAFKRQLLNMRTVAQTEKSNYLPSCIAVKKRMDSEHLNSWLVRSEIQYAAERRLEFNKLLTKATPDQLKEYRDWTKMQRQEDKTNLASKRSSRSANNTSNEHELTFNKAAQEEIQQSGSVEVSARFGKPDVPIVGSTRPHSTCASTMGRPRTSDPSKQRLFTNKKKNQDLLMDEDGDLDYSTNKYADKNSILKGHESILDTLMMDEKDIGGTSLIFNNTNSQYKSASALRLSTNSLKNHRRIGTQGNDFVDGAFTPEKNINQSIGSRSKARSFKVIVSAGSSARQGGLKLKSELRSKLHSQPRSKQNQEYNTQVSFAEKTKTIMSTSSHFNIKRPIYGDLVEAQEGKGRIVSLFKSAKWQKEKNQLVSSMHHHMQRHRPRVLLTAEQDKRRMELAGRAIEGNQRLQQLLTSGYGMKGMPDVPMPAECAQFLKEPSELAASKLKLDEKMRKERDQNANPCTRAMLQAKALETLNRSTQQSESSKQTSNQNQPRAGSMDSALRKAPLDPKPDIFSLTNTRLEQFNRTLTGKIETKKFERKATWKLRRSEEATGMICESERDRRAKAEEAREKERKSQWNGANVTQTNTQQTEQTNRESQYKANVTQVSDQRGRSLPQKTIPTLSDIMSKDTSSLEVRSPGIGAKARGKLLKKLTTEILKALDVEIIDNVYDSAEAQLTIPDIQRDQLWLNKHFKDMEGADFWLQKGLLCVKDGKSDAAMDYYRQGLRHNPTNETLLYSLALSYLQLKKFDSALRWFSYGIQLNPRWVDGLCGVSIAYFNMCDFEQSLQYIELAKENFKIGANRLPLKVDQEGQDAIDELPYASQINLNTITLIKAICMKETGRLDPGSFSYVSLEETFQQKRSLDMITMVWGCILVPLSNDRRLTNSHYRNLFEMLQHIREEPMPKMDRYNLLLSRFCINAFRDKKGFLGDKLYFRDYKMAPPKLDFETYEKSISTLIETKSFFKRFNALTYKDDKALFMSVMKRADVELYRKEQPIFLNERVAVVTMGSCEVRTHSVHNLLKPIVLKKSIEGDVIGAPFNEDAKQILSPLTWILSMQDFTEVVFFSREDFKILWNLLNQFTEQSLVVFKLNQNKFFRELNKCTKMHLVFECLDLKNFHPGQLMLSVHARSPLSTVFSQFFRDSKSKFREEIDNRIMRQLEKHASAYQGFIEALNVPSEEQIESASPKAQDQELKVPTLSETKVKWSDQAGVDHEASLVSLPRLNSAARSKESSTHRLSLRRYESRDDDEVSEGSDYGVSYCYEVMDNKRLMAKKDVYEVGKPVQEMESLDSGPDCTTVWELDDEEEAADVSQLNKLVNQLEKNPNYCYSKLPRMSVNMAPSMQNLMKFSSAVDDNLKLMENGQKGSSFKRAATLAKAPRKAMLTMESVDTQTGPSKDAKEEQQLYKRSKTENLTENQMSDLHVQVKYNFLFERYIDLIEKRDRKTRLEFRRRKEQIKYMIIFIEGLKQMFDPDQPVEDQSDLQKRLDTYSEMNQAGKVKLLEDPVPEGSSGFWNTLYIDRMKEGIDSILLSLTHIESSHELLLSFLVTEIDKKFTKQIDPEGIHFIATGDAFVIGPNGQQNIKLHTNESFGYSDLVKQPGPEYLGDVRAGLMPVQTYYLPFEHLNKRLSIKEKLAIYQVARSDERMDGVIKFVIRRDNIKEGDKMNNY